MEPVFLFLWLQSPLISINARVYRSFYSCSEYLTFLPYGSSPVYPKSSCIAPSLPFKSPDTTLQYFVLFSLHLHQHLKMDSVLTHCLHPLNIFDRFYYFFFLSGSTFKCRWIYSSYFLLVFYHIFSEFGSVNICSSPSHFHSLYLPLSSCLQLLLFFWSWMKSFLVFLYHFVLE